MEGYLKRNGKYGTRLAFCGIKSTYGNTRAIPPRKILTTGVRSTQHRTTSRNRKQGIKFRRLRGGGRGGLICVENGKEEGERSRQKQEPQTGADAIIRASREEAEFANCFSLLSSRPLICLPERTGVGIHLIDDDRCRCKHGWLDATPRYGGEPGFLRKKTSRGPLVYAISIVSAICLCFLRYQKRLLCIAACGGCVQVIQPSPSSKCILDKICIDQERGY